jgi:membrane protease YdiL (CAAX protease family)
MLSSKRSSPWLFFALVYGWSWLFWIPAALSGLQTGIFPVSILIAAGGISPMLVAIILTYLTRGGKGRQDYWRRVIDFKRIGINWYGVILFTVPLLTALAALLDVLGGGEGGQLEVAARILDQPLAIIPFAIFTLLFGPIPEELGWRGYALDCLQVKWSAFRSSLVLGAVWALWHLPLFFIPGTYQNGLGVGSRAFWLFVLGIVVTTIIMTWIYNNNRRSTLSAVLYHFVVNFTGELVELSARAECYQFLLLVAMAILVTIIWGPKTLNGKTNYPRMSDKLAAM